MVSTKAQAGLQVPLESVICTQELALRPPRQPDFEALNGALIALGRTLANSPERILQQLVETALDLCLAQSAGISLLEEEDGRRIFRWHGVAGRYAPHLWGTTPREFSPCGTVLDTDSVQLMSHLDRHFGYFAQVEPRIAEALLIPFHVGGDAVGTIWVISHDQTRKFDAEDARTITMLGEFAATAYQALSGTLTLKSVFATIRDPLLVLDGNLRVTTASRSFYQTFQVTPSITEGRLLHQIGDGEWDIPELRTLLEDIPPDESVFANFEVTKDFPSLGRRAMALSVRKLSREENPSGLILLTIEDITNRERNEEHLLLSQEDSRPDPGSRENIDDDLVEVTQNFDEMIGNSAALKRVMRQVEVVAPTDATVLILGETGTGKELIARALHRLSPRRNLPFVSLNCAAIPTGLLESELFGYERGAFTGALSQKRGRFELANGGTLFLDEVGDIPLDLQPKLLRALQEKAFERLGGTKTIAINVRLVAATNQNLTQMMRDKVFRNDLYYRLMVFPIVTPPLRDHSEDIPALARHFAVKYAAKMNRTIDTIPSETMKALAGWSWPGNVRELENFIERSVVLSPGPVLCAPLSELRVEVPERDGNSSLEDVERGHILRIFRETGGVISVAASILGMPRTTLNAKLKKLGISRGDL
ncbi:MAG: sigma 54-interacting transcriptional regulator [Bryobacteraceae bacterium]